MPVTRGGGASGAGGGGLSNGGVIQYGGIRQSPLAALNSRQYLPLVPGDGPVSAGTFSPTAISGLQAWYDADSQAGADGSSLTTIADTQASFAATAEFGSAVLRHNSQNSLKTLEVSGASFSLGTSLLASATEGSFFVVVKLTDDPSTTFIGPFLDGFTSDTGGNKNSHTPYTDGVFYEHFGLATRQTTGNPTSSFTSYRIYEVTVTSGGTFTVYVDGIQHYQATGQTVSFGSGITRRLLGNAGGNTVAGNLAEMTIYNRAPTQSEREQIEGYLAWRWGIQANLDASHPYKSAPPGGSAGAYTLTAAAAAFTLSGGAATLKRGLRLSASPGAFTLGAGVATFAKGYRLTAAAGAFALTGGAAALTRGLLLTAGAGSFSLSGGAATFRLGKRLVAAAATFALSGGAASFPLTRRLTAAAGSFALTGGAANLKRGVRLTAAAGAFSLNGGAASFLAGRKLVAAAGSLTLTGGAATLKRGLRLSAAAGSFTLTGGTVTLRRTYRMVAGAGAFVLTGQPATLIKTGSYALVAAAGSFALTGGSANLKQAKRLTADAGSYALTGGAATLTKLGLNAYTLVANPGAFSLTGGSAALTFIGNVWFVIHPAPGAVSITPTPPSSLGDFASDIPPTPVVLDTAVPPPSPAFVKAADPVAVELG